jgi:membrane-associated phospholipid phosphatase
MTWEFTVLDLIQRIRTPFLDTIMVLITKYGFLVFGVIGLILLFRQEKRRSAVILFMALLLDLLVCNGILKNVFARVRPCDVNTAVHLIIARPTDYSFPSGHTAFSFAAVSALYFSKERKFIAPALLTALLISFSRLYLYVHYPTDILGGMLTGILAGYAAFRLFRYFEKNAGREAQIRSRA